MPEQGQEMAVRFSIGSQSRSPISEENRIQYFASDRIKYDAAAVLLGLTLNYILPIWENDQK